ncbi:Hypothetical predicted protein [Pelobates cultripes]|uniref:Uncharacterized protein n=1 Tax=Pelobates cultripes TaxID=61616 RepID=A0AAD1VU14_PELCU|nr:Hypothetical predicted protein [Pelobates cultripes]
MSADHESEPGPTSSEPTPERQRDSHQPQPLREPQAKEDDLAPATKCDTMQLIREIKQMFDTDMNMARMEIKAVTFRVQATE